MYRKDALFLVVGRAIRSTLGIGKLYTGQDEAGSQAGNIIHSAKVSRLPPLTGPGGCGKASAYASPVLDSIFFQSKT